ncbi:hypothetical protein ES704_00874 [subsurface metagenome]|jgi:hypothetical protein
MFLLIANRKESEKIVTEKEDKKAPAYLTSFTFYLFFTGERLTQHFQPLHILYQNKNI